jgi:hypothetical protein
MQKISVLDSKALILAWESQFWAAIRLRGVAKEQPWLQRCNFMATVVRLKQEDDHGASRSRI